MTPAKRRTLEKRFLVHLVQRERALESDPEFFRARIGSVYRMALDCHRSLRKRAERIRYGG